MAFVLVALLLFLVIASAYYILGRRKYNLPPGPRGLPFIGNILDLYGRDFKTVLKEYRQKYGDIFTIRLFQKVYIVVNGYKLMTEMFVKNGENFSERAHLGMFSEMHPGHGFTSVGSPMWIVNRRFTLRVLRNLGMGKNIMQIQIQNEVNDLMDKIQEFDGKPFNILPLLYRSFGNALFQILRGKRFEDGDSLLDEIMNKANEQLSGLAVYTNASYKYIPGDPFRVRKFVKNETRLLQIYTKMVDEHMDKHQGETPTNFIDAYIKDMRESGAADGTMNKKELVSMVDVLVLAGGGTTVNILIWGIIYLLNDPSIQEKLIGELNKVVSEDREIDASDKLNMPYVEATINEMMRRSSIIPLSEARAPIKKTTVNGYDIPTDAFVMACLESALFDETMWSDPYAFKPSRFLSDDGSAKHIQELIPFSLGKRKCPGESLARMQLFLYFTTLIRKFEFKLPEDKDGRLKKSSFGLVLVPDELIVRAVPRKKI